MSIDFETNAAFETDLGIDSKTGADRRHKAPETLSERTRVQVALYTPAMLEKQFD